MLFLIVEESKQKVFHSREWLSLCLLDEIIYSKIYTKGKCWLMLSGQAVYNYFLIWTRLKQHTNANGYLGGSTGWFFFAIFMSSKLFVVL